MQRGINRMRYVNTSAAFQEINIGIMNEKVLERDIHKDFNSESRKLILFNSHHIWDDVVIQLQKATGFDIVQCEQIAIIAHTRGKAVVKSGEIDELELTNNILREINLVTSIE